MTQYTDSAALNGKTYTTNYFYNASASSSGAGSVNGSVYYTGTVTSGSQAAISGTISSSGNGYFTITSSAGIATTYQVLGSSADGSNLIFQTNQSQGSNSGPYFILSGTGTTPTGGSIDYDSRNSYTPPAQGLACFAAGTMILTIEGEVAVEQLAVGSVVVTAAGVAVPVVWIGRQRVRCDRAFDPTAIWPVKIAANAIGVRKPTRDLLVSPGHAIWFPFMDDGVLIPAAALINDATIMQEKLAEVEYWHIELEQHEVVVANGLPAESYIDVNNRYFFDNAQSHAVPDAPGRTVDDYCCPFAAEGSIVEAVRTTLRDRAMAQGWAPTTDDQLDMHLVVDGVRVEPTLAGQRARFVFPADAQDVWLQTATAVPRNVLGTGDGRRLGLMVTALRVIDGLEVDRSISPGDDRLCIGFHEAEEDDTQRWTTGRSRLPRTLWEGCCGLVMLSIDWGAALPQWQLSSAERTQVGSHEEGSGAEACAA